MTAATKKDERLRPGELDGLVLGYMRKHSFSWHPKAASAQALGAI